MGIGVLLLWVLTGWFDLGVSIGSGNINKGSGLLVFLGFGVGFGLFVIS